MINTALYFAVRLFVLKPWMVAVLPVDSKSYRLVVTNFVHVLVRILGGTRIET
jgi:hypothetical protein